MTRILKAVPASRASYLTQVCEQYFREAHGLRIVERSLGNEFTGMIDLLATDGSQICLVTIGTGEFSRSLFRSFMGYRWFRENREFLGRVYDSREIDLALPARLIILSEDIPFGAGAMCVEVCSVEVRLYRYRLFGTEDDPDISIEDASEPCREQPSESSIQALIRELGIGCTGITEQEASGLRRAMGFPE
ncbi:MAG: hypothetical protein WAR22_00495 [Desulfomonilia bacterium]